MADVERALRFHRDGLGLRSSHLDESCQHRDLGAGWRHHARYSEAMRARLVESPDEHVWEIGGRDVTLLLVDRGGGFRFHCWTLDGDLEIRFGTPFVFRTSAGHDVPIDPEQPRTIAPLLDLIRTAVSRIAVRRAGDVTVSFSDGSSLASRPHPAYEAWEINGVGELSEVAYLCGPGGGSPWG